ncbi:zinc finger CCCH domain-containing protein 46-like isoform X2 [Mangifera indica]|uniref:zinc finger CCCH domain-containing protein 46-like isoform X2 n=1 Tax=Mangifera indica TaxID=29780 RepID=UPI001CFB8F1E|nr:zinc finger CCCH domain-containing protein 46-like isoform X2 [Mangifera indica]
MDGYEATRIVFSRIQNLDPENASKIMGLLLIQDHGEKEMIRLAFGPEALVHSLILKARKELGLPSNSPNSPSTPPSPSPFMPNNPVNISRQNSSSSSRLLANTLTPLTIPNPSSSSGGTSPWGALSHDLPNPDDLITPNTSSKMNSSALPFYANGGGGSNDIIDDIKLQDHLSFLNDNSPSLVNKNQDLFYPQLDLSSSPPNGDSVLFSSYWGGSLVHRRSCSVSDVLGSAEDLNSGFGWRPCLYYARGYCKNGSNCRFIHGDSSGAAMMSSDGAPLVGSLSKIETMDQCHEILRSKSAAQVQQQRLAAAASHLMGGSSFPYSPKSMNLFLQQQQNDTQRAAAALMMNEDMHKFARTRLERNDFSSLVNPASRQIYLTFPADSTFREEDVSSYFRMYGPVQDVRIPYQQKRMFGFVTFVFPETVKIILAKGNPHFVCDARVLVKPYKEKGKVPDKKQQQQQQVDRGEFSPCATPTGLDSRDPFDLQGASIFYNNTQDTLWRRKMEEQADLQQALELQSRRLMGLQLLDVKNKHHHHRALSTGSPIPSPTHSPSLFHQNLVFPPFQSSGSELHQENGSSPLPSFSVSPFSEKQTTNASIGKETASSEENGSGKESSNGEDGDLPEILEHNLPDSPFASPTKGCSEYLSAFSSIANGAEKDESSSANNNLVTSNLLPANDSLDRASFKSFNCQMPRFSSGHGAIGLYTGTGGPTCPVGI